MQVDCDQELSQGALVEGILRRSRKMLSTGDVEAGQAALEEHLARDTDQTLSQKLCAWLQEVVHSKGSVDSTNNRAMFLLNSIRHQCSQNGQQQLVCWR